MRLRLFALFVFIDACYSIPMGLKFLQQSPLEPYSLHGFQQYLLNSSAHERADLATKPSSEEVVARFLLDYERIEAKIHNKAIIDISMKPIASFIEVIFEVHLQSNTPFVIVNNKKLCVGKCWVDLQRVGDSISVNFTGDPSNVIYVNRRGPTHFTFTYDSCEQPLNDVQCRHRKGESSTVCICNEGVDSCDFSSPPLLDEEECNFRNQTTGSSTPTSHQMTTTQTTTLHMTTLQTTTRQVTTLNTTTRQVTTPKTTTRQTTPIRTSGSTPRADSTTDLLPTTTSNVGSASPAWFTILIHVFICSFHSVIA